MTKTIQLNLLDQLFDTANREHEFANELAYSALLHAKKSGEALLEAKKESKKQGLKWLEVLKEKSFSR